MSTPIIWIFVPIILSILLWLLPDSSKLRLSIGIVTSLTLALLAWRLPIGSTFHIGPWPVIVVDNLTILGRTLTLGISTKPMLTFYYLITAVWFLGGIVLNITSVFPPLGLTMVALFVASLAVEPFLYGALLIEIAVIVSMLILAPPGKIPGQGMLRYLIFQTLGIPFILFTGWMLDGIQAGPADPALILRSMIMFGFGFAFLLAVFPFNTWLPLLTAQSEPYVTGFILVMLPMTVLLFALNFINSYTWLQTEPILFEILRVGGVLMIATGGIWAAFQHHLGRLLGYAIIVETGFALLAISLKNQGGLQLFSVQLLPRAIAIWVWVLSISSLQQKVGLLDFKSVRGQLRSLPFIAGSLLIAQFSIAGGPLLASFPTQGALFLAIFQFSPILALWAFTGNLGLLLAGFRSLNNLAVQVKGEGWKINEMRWEAVLLCLGVLALLVIGFFPQWILPGLMHLLEPYANLL